MSEIKITWQGDEIVLPLAAAEGFAESLEEAGESFEWEALDPPAPQQTTPADIPWTGDGRDHPQFEGANAVVEDALRASSDAPNHARPRQFVPGEENLRSAVSAWQRSPGSAFGPMAGKIQGTSSRCWLKHLGQRTEFSLAELPEDLAGDLLSCWPELR